MFWRNPDRGNRPACTNPLVLLMVAEGWGMSYRAGVYPARQTNTECVCGTIQQDLQKRSVKRPLVRQLGSGSGNGVVVDD